MDESNVEIVGEIKDIEIIAVNASIRELMELKKRYGGNRWRKLKGIAVVVKKDKRDATVVRMMLAEVHWYECNGIGRRQMKVKRYLEE